jgi:hypothetical protein
MDISWIVVGGRVPRITFNDTAGAPGIIPRLFLTAAGGSA